MASRSARPTLRLLPLPGLFLPDPDECSPRRSSLGEKPEPGESCVHFLKVERIGKVA